MDFNGPPYNPAVPPPTKLTMPVGLQQPISAVPATGYPVTNPTPQFQYSPPQPHPMLLRPPLMQQQSPMRIPSRPQIHAAHAVPQSGDVHPAQARVHGAAEPLSLHPATGGGAPQVVAHRPAVSPVKQQLDGSGSQQPAAVATAEAAGGGQQGPQPGEVSPGPPAAAGAGAAAAAGEAVQRASACAVCGAEGDLSWTECGHMALCGGCGKRMAEKEEACRDCGVVVSRLVKVGGVSRGWH